MSLMSRKIYRKISRFFAITVGADMYIVDLDCHIIHQRLVCIFLLRIFVSFAKILDIIWSSH